MIKKIVKKEKILTQVSEPVGPEESIDELIQDMKDTAEAHKDNCVGLAAIQIGVPKRVILVRIKDNFVPFINPRIIWKSAKTYVANEGCLSIDGVRSVRRSKDIKVVYLDTNRKSHSASFSGYLAEIIQHEVDHTNGVLI